MFDLTHLIRAKIELEALRAAPREACGLAFIDGSVVLVPNRSQTPESSFEMRWRDTRDAVKSLGMLELLNDPADECLIWHSHPNGFIGPSKEDVVQRKLDETGVNYLVVSLVPREPAIFTRY